MLLWGPVHRTANKAAANPLSSAQSRYQVLWTSSFSLQVHSYSVRTPAHRGMACFDLSGVGCHSNRWFPSQILKVTCNGYFGQTKFHGVGRMYFIYHSNFSNVNMVLENCDFLSKWDVKNLSDFIGKRASNFCRENLKFIMWRVH